MGWGGGGAGCNSVHLHLCVQLDSTLPVFHNIPQIEDFSGLEFVCKTMYPCRPFSDIRCFFWSQRKWDSQFVCVCNPMDSFWILMVCVGSREACNVYTQSPSITISTQGHEARPAPKASVRWSRDVSSQDVLGWIHADAKCFNVFHAFSFHHTSVLLIVLIVLVGVSSCAEGSYKHPSKHVLTCTEPTGSGYTTADVSSPDLGGLPQSSATSGSSQSTSNCLSVECCDVCIELFAAWWFLQESSLDISFWHTQFQTDGNVLQHLQVVYFDLSEGHQNSWSRTWSIVITITMNDEWSRSPSHPPWYSWSPWSCCMGVTDTLKFQRKSSKVPSPQKIILNWPCPENQLQFEAPMNALLPVPQAAALPQPPTPHQQHEDDTDTMMMSRWDTKFRRERGVQSRPWSASFGRQGDDEPSVAGSPKPSFTGSVPMYRGIQIKSIQMIYLCSPKLNWTPAKMKGYRNVSDILARSMHWKGTWLSGFSGPLLGLCPGMKPLSFSKMCSVNSVIRGGSFGKDPSMFSHGSWSCCNPKYPNVRKWHKDI